MNSKNIHINKKSDICKHINNSSVCSFIDCHFSLLILRPDNYKTIPCVRCQISDKCGCPIAQTAGLAGGERLLRL